MGEHEKELNLQNWRILEKELIYNGFMPRVKDKKNHKREAKRQKLESANLQLCSQPTNFVELK